MKRTIETVKSDVQSVPVNTDTDLHEWLTQQAQAHNLCWLLAHADDGVIWGKLRDDKKLHLSSDAHPDISPPLRWQTLQQCRLFGEDGELLLWQGSTGWQACLRSDTEGKDVEYIDEKQLLWGYTTEHHKPVLKDGFCCVYEGSTGIAHTPPVTNAPTEKNRAKLRVRHYLITDEETGMVRIGASRLVELIEPNRKEQNHE